VETQLEKTMQELQPHPLAGRFPLLEGEEFDSLKASIHDHGLRVPIVLFQGMILDGRNRYQACRGLRIEPKTEEFVGTEAEAAVLSDVLNLERRHLTREQKRAVIAYKLKQNPEQSDRGIADEVKVDHKTVATVRASLEPGGEIPHLPEEPRKVLGRDKKKYTVKPKPAQLAKPAVSQEDAASNQRHRARAFNAVAKAIDCLKEIRPYNPHRQEAIAVMPRWLKRNFNLEERPPNADASDLLGRLRNFLQDSKDKKPKNGFISVEQDILLDLLEAVVVVLELSGTSGA